MVTLSIIGFVISVLTAAFVGHGAIDKIRGTQESVGNFAYMKLENIRVATGVGELLAAVLLVIPATSLYGAVLMSCFMSGAIALHLSLMGGNKTYIPFLVGVAAVVGYILTSSF
jgi:uncharacterized membrane protein YphA (DoxX/SURF4 family)